MNKYGSLLICVIMLPLFMGISGCANGRIGGDIDEQTRQRVVGAFSAASIAGISSAFSAMDDRQLTRLELNTSLAIASDTVFAFLDATPGDDDDVLISFKPKPVDALAHRGTE